LQNVSHITTGLPKQNRNSSHSYQHT